METPNEFFNRMNAYIKHAKTDRTLIINERRIRSYVKETKSPNVSKIVRKQTMSKYKKSIKLIAKKRKQLNKKT